MRNPLSSRLPCGMCENDLIAEAFAEAAPITSRQVSSHVATCRACAALLEQYRQLRVQFHTLPIPGVSVSGLHAARRALDVRLGNLTRPRLFLGIWHSPVGEIRIGKTDTGIALVEFVNPAAPRSLPPALRQTFVVESGGQEIAELVHKLADYLSGKRRDLGWIVDDALVRSDFQRQVLQATAAVPYGTVVTYQGLAAAIGHPKAVRAVAQALRHNPVPIHIPCHRVVGSDGSLTGYAGNRLEIKKRILEVEGIPVTETAKGPLVVKDRMYVGWRRDHCFCRPGCPSLKDQPAGDRVLIPSRIRAEEMGYVPCNICRPDAHPLPEVSPPPSEA
ncbi:MAG: methylated-DNA--[protein]-cysteine S-methyltransferase [Candidatus Binatia bacterium]|nr:methylated-DNA--[protein]-cysteine S-methyltransferase [Candidatus Binatia bacterium]